MPLLDNPPFSKVYTKWPIGSTPSPQPSRRWVVFLSSSTSEQCLPPQAHFISPALLSRQLTIPTITYPQQLRGWSVLWDSRAHSLAKAFSTLLDPNAGQLFRACTPRVCVNMHHMTPVWKHGSCKHIGRTETLKDVAGIHLRAHKAGLIYPKTLHKLLHVRPLIDKCSPAAPWKSVVHSSPGFQASISLSHWEATQQFFF